MKLRMTMRDPNLNNGELTIYEHEAAMSITNGSLEVRVSGNPQPIDLNMQTFFDNPLEGKHISHAFIGATDEERRTLIAAGFGRFFPESD